MKQYKKQIVFMFGAIAVFSYLSIHYFQVQPVNDAITVMEETSQEQLQIYVLDQDNTLIPMDISIDPGMSIEDKVKTMITAMCKDQVKGSFTGVLGSGTALSEVSLKDTTISLTFNDAFATYQEDQELQVLEAITWGATQFPEIKTVELYQGSNKLTEMPLAHTPIPDPLNRSLGINHFESATGSLSDSDTITVYYTKDVEGVSYFVPKSKRIQGDASDMETVVREVLKDVSVSSHLESPLFADNIDTMDLPRKEEDTLVVNMNNALLESDRTAKQTAYEALVLSLADNFEVDEVKVFVEDNVVSLHGSNEEAVSVSSLHYNPVPF